MNNDETVFGVNFVDGRIKGYPKYNPRTKKAILNLEIKKVTRIFLDRKVMLGMFITM